MVSATQGFPQGPAPGSRRVTPVSNPPMTLSLDDAEIEPLPPAPPRDNFLIAPPQDSKMPLEPDEQMISDELLTKPLAAIEIKGNVTIPEYAILQIIRVRVNRPVSRPQIEDDVKALVHTRYFFNVVPRIRMSDNGPVLIFRVTERPILNSVTFQGNKKIKSKELEAQLGLIKGHAFDVSTNKECVERIKSLYRDKGYRHAQVTLAKGGNPNERDVLFVIDEGERSKVWGLNFEGNKDQRTAVLKTKLTSKRVILWWLGGDYDPHKIDEDVYAVTKYYNDLGYFDAKVTPKVSETDEWAKVYVTFHVEEGVQYHVRNIEVQGNTVISREQLLAKQSLKVKDAFNARFLRKDVDHMKSKYDETGRLFAKVQPTPRFLEKPGLVDIVYQIDEDKPYRIGSINVHIRGDHPHSQEYVVRNQVNAFLKPGHLASGQDVKLAIGRVQGSAFWDKTDRPTIDVHPSNSDWYRGQSQIARGQSDDQSDDSVSDFLADLAPSPFTRSRMQTAGFTPFAQDPVSATVTPREAALPRAFQQTPAAQPMNDAGQAPPGLAVPPQTSRAARPQAEFASVNSRPAPTRAASPFDGAVAQSTAITRTAARQQSESVYNVDPEALFSLGDEDLMTIRAQSPEDVYRGQSQDRGGLPVPQNYMGAVSPQGDPFGDSFNRPPAAGEPGYVDVNIDVTEGRTGRLMFGVGVNSDAGLIGQFTLQEDNFDILRPPTSWADIVNGQAFRGRGQSFRLEAMPGNQVSRYLASWQDPFFMQTDYNLGVSGFYYNRFYQEWTEDRLGGRISLGRLLSRYWSFGTALRLENVQIRNFNLPAPQSILDVQGDNFLSTASVKLSHDSRDSAFMPTYGHLWEVSYEQGFGEFTYPRAETSFGQYFTIFERPDGFGKHILSFRSQLGWTGDGTPIFEKFYAGGYSSFRGFQFRGVSPRDTGYRVGGNFMTLNTLEYMAPITADDNIRVVGFTDFGTVDTCPTLQNFRMTAGFGLRLTIPAMGPAPIALDFAFPIMDQKEDNRRIFSFYVGFTN